MNMVDSDKSNGTTAPSIPATIAAPAAPQPKIIGQMQDSEKMRVENIGLLNENIQLREDRLQQEANELTKLKAKLRDDTMRLRQDIVSRLGTGANPEKIRLRTTGDVEEMP